MVVALRALDAALAEPKGTQRGVRRSLPAFLETIAAREPEASWYPRVSLRRTLTRDGGGATILFTGSEPLREGRFERCLRKLET